MHREYLPVLGDCPICGKKEGASMGSSSWGHNIECCSQECGERLGEIIKQNIDKKKYRKAVKALEKAKDRVRKIKYDGTGVDYDPMEYFWDRI